jgi:hypothetical protein
MLPGPVFARAGVVVEADEVAGELVEGVVDELEDFELPLSEFDEV